MAVIVKQVLFMTAAVLSFLSGLIVWRYLITLTNIWAAFTASFLGIFAFLSVNLYYRIAPDVSLPFSRILTLYIGKLIFMILGHWSYNRLNNDSQNIRKTQDECLMQMIQANKDTVYGRQNNFKSVATRNDFVKVQKLTTYHDMKDYIDCIGKGEQGVLTQDPVIQLGSTAGTTNGITSLLPIVKAHINCFLKCLAITQYLIHHYLPTSRQVRPTLRFMYPAKWTKSKGGLPVGPVSRAKTSKHILKQFTTPPEAYAIEREAELCYIHWLFALQYSSIGMITSTFASVVYSAMTYLQDHWEQLVDDLETGQINAQLDIDKDVRTELNMLLKPSPWRAAELRSIFEKGFDGIILLIWPHCHLIDCVDSGSLSLSGDLLKASYCKGITFYSTIYGSTEGLTAINMWPLNPRREYVLMPSVSFYEFIPEDQMEEEQPKTLFADQVEVGSTYELVLTTVNGLYRYRFGDVIRISRLHHECPVVEFVYRKGQLLNITLEKTPEPAVLEAVTRTVKEWPETQVTDYCCALNTLLDQAPDGKSIGHYVVFLELLQPHNNLKITQEQKAMLDKQLMDIWPRYATYRSKGSIGPMVVYIVCPGTFAKFRQHKLDTSAASSNQFKVPRLLKNKADGNFMMEHLEY